VAHQFPLNGLRGRGSPAPSCKNRYRFRASRPARRGP
jgi:hypothetical protein